MTLIKLDLDNIMFRNLESRIEFIKKFSWCKSIIVKESSKMAGYHLQIQTFWKLKQKAVFRIRYDLNDDPKRLIRDMLEIGDNLLFSYKLEKKKRIDGTTYASHLWSSTDLFKWSRNQINSEWKKT